MVLKDASGFVKLYALVNVEHPSVVATAPNQSEAMKAYKALLVENEIIASEQEPELEFLPGEVLVEEIRTYTIDGNTVFYFIGHDGYYYKGYLKDFEDLIFVKVGYLLKIESTDSENYKIKVITDFDFVGK